MSNLVTVISNAMAVLPHNTLAAASGSSNYFETVAKSISDFINTALPFVWVLVGIAVIGVGLLCIIGSDRSKEIAKSKFVYICIGAALIVASFYIAKGIFSAFGGDTLKWDV